MNALPIAEQFHSIQGEGPHAGTPSLFLRLGGCNLLCGDPDNPDAPQEQLEKSDDATWLCDTIEVWRDPDVSENPGDIVNSWSENGWLNNLARGDHLILTGGEPTLHQEGLITLMEMLDATGVDPFVEVETNGTRELDQDFIKVVDHLNISLKLSNSGMPHEKRINEEAIQQHVMLLEEEYSGVTGEYKFVVGREADIHEIDDLVEEYDIPEEHVMLMPAGYTQDDLEVSAPVVAEMAMARGWRYTPRLHVDLWDTATGV